MLTFSHDGSRPSSPSPNDDDVGRSLSFDSFSDVVLPRAKKGERRLLSLHACADIGALMETLSPLLSFLRHNLSSPFHEDSDERLMSKNYFNGGSMFPPHQIEIGTSVVFRTKREKKFEHSEGGVVQCTPGFGPERRYRVIEDELQSGLIIEQLRFEKDPFLNDSVDNNREYNVELTVVYTMLLPDGTLEVEVPPEAIVTSSAPMIPFQSKQDMQLSLHSGNRLQCTSAHMVQVNVI